MMKAGWYGTVVFFVVLAGQAGDDELEASEQLVGVLGLGGLLPGLKSTAQHSHHSKTFHSMSC
jgi:hypothetical protein